MRFIGILGGALAVATVAHFYSRTESGKQFFGGIAQRARNVREAFEEGWRVREQEIREAIEGDTNRDNEDAR